MPRFLVRVAADEFQLPIRKRSLSKQMLLLELGMNQTVRRAMLEEERSDRGASSLKASINS